MKEQDYSDIICRQFCSFFKEGKEELHCGTYEFLVENFTSPELAILCRTVGQKSDRTPDPEILHKICSQCAFLVDGCDFRDGLASPPCGGYVIIETLMMQAGKIAKRLV